MTISKLRVIVSLLLAVPLLFAAGIAGADQRDARLDHLFVILRQTDNADIAQATEEAIWDIWLEHDDEQTQALLAEGTVAMNADPRKALAIFDQLVEDVPDFAEGWNKRATLLYLLGDYAGSARDIEKTLELEPRHFGALSGLGLVYLAQEKYVRAKSAFEAVLLIHPNSGGVRRNIELIDNYIRRHAI